MTKEKSFNGFRSEEQYLQALNAIKEIVEIYDTYNRDIFMVSKKYKWITVDIDDFSISFYEDMVEIGTKVYRVDNGIVNIVCGLKQAIEDGVFKFMEE